MSPTLPLRALGSALVLGCLLTSSPLAAQTPSSRRTPPLSYSDPRKAGVSPARLARIDALCEEAVKEGQIPGVVALVARNGRIVYHKAYGMADNAAGRKLQRDDIFRIASQSKAITATGVMMLWEEGKFRLADPKEKTIGILMKQTQGGNDSTAWKFRQLVGQTIDD